jgi:lysozyme
MEGGHQVISEVDIRDLKEQLIVDEGAILKPYRCTAGKLTIGVGRNLEDKGITKDEALYLLNNDIKEVFAQLDKYFPWWTTLTPARQKALANFVFNVGIGTALTFKNTMNALAKGDWEGAAKGFENSKWYGQVGNRAKRIVETIRKG